MSARAAACPCGSGRGHAACCRPLHEGAAAPDAAALMRARYCAYVLRDAAYLRASWHPATCPADLDLSDGPAWLGLDVRRHVEPADAAVRAQVAAVTATSPAAGDVAVVEFVARFRVGGGRVQRMQERSRFAREHGRWLYVDGDVA
ncbi:YchJ family protein [Coralloluteibacterium thermophilus]|uniref:UPF0225 protein ACFO3Q_09550 n=1 Tax=Coralloluteibacterium thermophilum TaxID=2707049 RepID=A0ABV9NJG4_9GAMM